LKYSLVLFLGFYALSAHSQSNDAINVKDKSILKKTNIQVSKLTKPSLGSLGVKTKINTFMGLNVWENLQATEIIENLNYIPDVVASKSLQNFLNQMYVSTSNPPIGNTESIIKFIETRLLKIKSGGDSKKLYQLVKQLPDTKKWDLWKRWQVEFELFNVKDKEACKYINEKSKNTSEDFWQMGRVFCLILNGKRDQSEFVLDLIKSRGFSNQIFENLFNYVFDQKKSINFQNQISQIRPIHLVMMDSLKLPIEPDYVAHLGIEYTDSLLTLNYLTPKAKSFLLDIKINYTDITVETIIQNYKSVADGKVDVQMALLNYSKEPNAYNRANVWFSIIGLKDELIKTESIIDFVKLEAKNGRFNEAVKLYLPILKEIDSAFLTKNLIDIIEELKVIANPNSFPDNKLANMILLKKGYEWDWSFVFKENAWLLIPIVERAGMIEPPAINWLNYINTIDDTSFDNAVDIKWDGAKNIKNYILAKSIKQASDKNQKSLTVLLVARLISDAPLIDFDLNNLITIKSSLYKIGLEDLANSITYEVMSSKLISY
jgi:hypothetical protein